MSTLLEKQLVQQEGSVEAQGERCKGPEETVERNPSGGLIMGNDPVGQRPEIFTIVTPTSVDTHFESSRKMTNDESKIELTQSYSQSYSVHDKEALSKDLPSCALCRGLGTPTTCGSLVPVCINGQEAAVHHACAVWAPQVYESEDPLGVKTYNNLESEWTRSQSQPCEACLALGAAICCAQPGCQVSYHLPCAVHSADVLLDKDTFELWCPMHANLRSDDEQQTMEDEAVAASFQKSVQRKNSRTGKTAEEDEDFCPYRRPRRNAAASRRHRFQRVNRSSTPAGAGAGAGAQQVKRHTTYAPYATSTTDNRVQRPRTDWQRHGHIWVKVVPPWWAEHRTIHFANKVFRELFCGITAIVLVDDHGCHWDCHVNCETRNDLRLQFTLGGQFTDYWDSAGISSGDVLTFERDNPEVGKIRIRRYPQGQGLDDVLFGSQNASTGGLSNQKHQYVYPGNTNFTMEATTSTPSDENCWVDSQDGAFTRILNTAEVAQGQCQIPSGVFQKLYDRSPEEIDTAPVLDSSLGKPYIFEVALMSTSDAYWIRGPAFSAWLSDAALVPGDQIKVWKAEQQVIICRVAAKDAQSLPHSLGGTTVRQRRSSSFPVYQASNKHSHGQTPTIEALQNDTELQALHTLAAAANYAGQHGTPAIHAVLSHAADIKALHAQGIDKDHIGTLKDRLRAAGIPPPPSPLFKKIRSDAELETSRTVADGRIHRSGGGLSESFPSGNLHSNASSIPLPQPQLVSPQRLHPSIFAAPGNAMAVTHPHFHYALQHHSMMNQIKGQHQPAGTTDNGKQRLHNSSIQKEWQPSQGATAFAAILSVLGKHSWNAEETGLILKFRAKYVLLDGVGREVAFLSIMQFQNNKNALIEMLRGLLENTPPDPLNVATNVHSAN